MQLNRMPTYTEPLETNEVTTRGWFSFWAGLFSGQPAGLVSSIAVSASPFNYVAPVGGTVIVNGGTVSLIKLSRDGTTFFTTGVTAGVFPVSQGDTLQVTYLAAPTITFLPR